MDVASFNICTEKLKITHQFIRVAKQNIYVFVWYTSVGEKWRIRMLYHLYTKGMSSVVSHYYFTLTAKSQRNLYLLCSYVIFGHVKALPEVPNILVIFFFGSFQFGMTRKSIRRKKRTLLRPSKINGCLQESTAIYWRRQSMTSAWHAKWKWSNWRKYTYFCHYLTDSNNGWCHDYFILSIVMMPSADTHQFICFTVVLLSAFSG